MVSVRAASATAAGQDGAGVARRPRDVEKRRAGAPPGTPTRRGMVRRAAVPSNYLTTTVFTADVCDAETCVTRTRILYLPFLAGAFHLSL